MKQQEFIIKFYGKSELAMLYYDGDSPENAMSKFRVELKRNPRLCHLEIGRASCRERVCLYV